MSAPSRKSVPQTGAELLVKSLEEQGVEYVFGIPGAKIDKVFDTLLDSKIKTVVCRHEQNAAFIAGGIGRMTLALYWRRAFRKKVCTSAALWRAFDKAVRRKPPVVAADAGPMQIQLREGAVSRRAGVVRQSTAKDRGS